MALSDFLIQKKASQTRRELNEYSRKAGKALGKQQKWSSIGRMLGQVGAPLAAAAMLSGPIGWAGTALVTGACSYLGGEIGRRGARSTRGGKVPQMSTKPGAWGQGSREIIKEDISDMRNYLKESNVSESVKAGIIAGAKVAGKDLVEGLKYKIGGVSDTAVDPTLGKGLDPLAEPGLAHQNIDVASQKIKSIDKAIAAGGEGDLELKKALQAKINKASVGVEKGDWATAKQNYADQFKVSDQARVLANKARAAEKLSLAAAEPKISSGQAAWERLTSKKGMWGSGYQEGSLFEQVGKDFGKAGNELSQGTNNLFSNLNQALDLFKKKRPQQKYQDSYLSDYAETRLGPGASPHLYGRSLGR